ncbi:hypothetical protein EDB89DRAFT_1906249 [Lactarius sanguifluus]|nr:hypothetical protein EDB89DRAFT_1906249 [Lactarius sanguifluus]
MTEAKWKKLLRGADEEFAVNEALTEIGDPRLTGEVNRLRRQSAVKDTLEELLQDAHRRATDITRQLVDVECEVTRSRIRLEMADAYKEINNRFLRTFNRPSQRSPELTPLPITNRGGPVEFPVRHDEERPCCIHCFGCKTYRHRVQDCVKRKKNHRRKEKSTPSPHVSSTVDHEERNNNKLTLLERIALLDWEEWTPEAYDRLVEKRSDFGARALKIVEQVFRQAEYLDNARAVSQYARWATKGDGPALWRVPSPQGALSTDDDYVLIKKPIVNSRLVEYSYPKGAVALAAAGAFSTFESDQQVQASLFSWDSHGSIVTDYMKNLKKLSERHWKSLLIAYGTMEEGQVRVQVSPSKASSLESMRHALYIPSSP